MTKREKKIMEIAVEIDRLLSDGIEIHPNSPIHEKLNQALSQSPVSGSILSKEESEKREEKILYWAQNLEYKSLPAYKLVENVKWLLEMI